MTAPRFTGALREAMLEAMRAEPDVTLEILRSITRKQRLFALQLETAMFKKAPARVAVILSRLATYYGTPAGGRGTRLALHLSHEVLANMIGVTRVTVTREIGALIRDGIITRDKRHLIVRHPAHRPGQVDDPVLRDMRRRLGKIDADIVEARGLRSGGGWRGHDLLPYWRR